MTSSVGARVRINNNGESPNKIGLLNYIKLALSIHMDPTILARKDLMGMNIDPLEHLQN